MCRSSSKLCFPPAHQSNIIVCREFFQCFEPIVLLQHHLSYTICIINVPLLSVKTLNSCLSNVPHHTGCKRNVDKGQDVLWFYYLQSTLLETCKHKLLCRLFLSVMIDVVFHFKTDLTQPHLVLLSIKLLFLDWDCVQKYLIETW